MALPVESKTIEGTVYRVTLLGGLKSLEILSRIGMGTISKISALDIMWLADELAQTTAVGVVDSAIVDGVERGSGRVTFVQLSTMFDAHFGGGPDARRRLLAWLEFAIEANYGPFGGVLLGIPRILRAVSSLSSPTTSPSSPGDSPPTPAAAASA